MASNCILDLKMVYMYKDDYCDRYFFEVKVCSKKRFYINSFLDYISKAEIIEGVNTIDVLEDIKEPNKVNIVKHLGSGCHLVEVLTLG